MRRRPIRPLLQPVALLIKFGAPVFIVSKLLAMIPGLSGVALVPGAIVDLSVALGLQACSYVLRVVSGAFLAVGMTSTKVAALLGAMPA